MIGICNDIVWLGRRNLLSLHDEQDIVTENVWDSKVKPGEAFDIYRFMHTDCVSHVIQC